MGSPEPQRVPFLVTFAPSTPSLRVEVTVVVRMEATRGRSKQPAVFLVLCGQVRCCKASQAELWRQHMENSEGRNPHTLPPQAQVTWSPAPGGRGKRLRLLCVLCVAPENFMIPVAVGRYLSPADPSCPGFHPECL